MTDPVDRGRNRSETFAEFARAEGKLKKLGLGPDVLRVPGTRIERITPEARQAWRERMAELAKSETAQLEAERRRAQAAEAGKLAAQSPNHVSRRTAKRRGLLEAAGAAAPPSGADCLRPPATASPSGPIPCLQAVCPRFRSRERLCR
jgi:hypothetical protein